MEIPYLCGEMGGAAFILIYLVFLLVMGIPVLVTEFAVGRASRYSVAAAYETGAGRKPLASHKMDRYYRKLSSDDVLYDRWRLDALLLLSLCDRRVRWCVF